MAAPAELMIRPQLGSPPAMAVLTRAEFAMARATRTAPASLRRDLFLPQGPGAPLALPTLLGGRPRPAASRGDLS